MSPAWKNLAMMTKPCETNIAFPIPHPRPVRSGSSVSVAAVGSVRSGSVRPLGPVLVWPGLGPVPVTPRCELAVARSWSGSVGAFTETETQNH